MRLIVPTSRVASPGDFNARPVGNELEVPREIADVVETQGIQTAGEFLSYADAFPSALAHTLGWSPVDAQRATRALSEQLREDVELAAARPKVHFGARAPGNRGN
jgi:hypothetical protein